MELCIKIQNKSGKKLVDFKNVLHSEYQDDINNLKENVNKFADQFDFYEEMD